MKKLGIFILNTIFLILVPLFTLWWIFIPVALIFLLLRQFYAPITAGFVLDLIYVDTASNLPLFTILGLVFSLASIFVQDRLRF